MRSARQQPHRQMPAATGPSVCDQQCKCPVLTAVHFQPTHDTPVRVCMCWCMQALLEAFDASNVTSGMLWSLIQGWCGDVAAALAAHATDVEPSVQLAANAAAGRWSAVVRARKQHQCTLGACRSACCFTDDAFVGADIALTALLRTSEVFCVYSNANGVVQQCAFGNSICFSSLDGSNTMTECGRRLLLLLLLLQVSSLLAERERSVYFPAPAPPGSQLHHKLLAAAAGAIMHGQFGAAQVSEESKIHCCHQVNVFFLLEHVNASAHTLGPCTAYLMVFASVLQGCEACLSAHCLVRHGGPLVLLALSECSVECVVCCSILVSCCAELWC
jgi:hypothetical protein